ncbi:hypothetical protein Ancab_014251 [Ancistrocladus abbreviatus]
MKFVPTIMLFCQISEVFRDCSLHGETENHKDSPSSAVTDAYGDSRHKRSSSKWKDDLSPASSMVTESNHASELISGSKLPTGEMTMSEEMDLLVEQVKMLVGDIAFSTSTLKRLLKQSVNDPNALKTQIQNLELEIQEKRRQMRILEQRIIQSNEASVSNASLVDMQQNQKLLEESSYAKELASVVAIELKNLAGSGMQIGSVVSRKCNDAVKPDDLKIELQASKQREAALEAALAKKEFAEEEYRKKVEEAKKREASLENDLVNMWVLVAKLKKEGGAIPDSKSEESVNVGDIGSGQKINGFDVKDVLMETESLENIRSVHDTTKEEPLVSRLMV